MDRDTSRSKVRGRPIIFREGIAGFVIVHPSYILRLRDQRKDDVYERFVAELKRVARLVPKVRARPPARTGIRRSA